MDESMKSDEPKGLLNEIEFDEMTEALINTSEAEGSGASEEAESSESIEDTAVAPADAESESDEEVEDVPEEGVPLSTVELVFADDSATTVVVDVDFQLVLRGVCNEAGERPVAFESVGDLTAEELRLLSKVIS